MDLGTLTNATAELLLFGLVAGVVLTGLTWLLIRTLRSLTAATTYLMLYLTLVAILLVPIFKALPEFPTTRQGTPNIISDLAEAPVAPVATAEGPAAQPTPALEVSTATLSPPVPSPQYRPSPTAPALEGSAAVEPTPPRTLASLPRISSLSVPASWLTVISSLFIVGFLFMAVRLLRGYLLLHRCRARSLPASDQHQLLLKRGYVEPWSCAPPRTSAYPWRQASSDR